MATTRIHPFEWTSRH